MLLTTVTTKFAKYLPKVTSVIVIACYNIVGEVTTFAGSGTNGCQDGITSAAQFNLPGNIACYHKTGDLYVADQVTNKIRKISLEGIADGTSFYLQ